MDAKGETVSNEARWRVMDGFLVNPEGRVMAQQTRTVAVLYDLRDACNALQEQADLAAGLRGRLKVTEMMLAQVKGRFMVEGSSVDAETAQGYFLGLLDNDILVSELRHEAAGLRAKAELADEMRASLKSYNESAAIGLHPSLQDFIPVTWLARWTKAHALNPQPHHEGGEG